jgi:hypothetical protein
MGIAINMHFCHDRLIDLAVNSPAHNCCDMNDSGANQSQDTCPGCQDKSIHLEPGDDYELPAIAFNFENSHQTTLFFSSVILNYFQGIEESIKNEVPWYKKPPPCQEVVLSKIQSYLI